MAYTDSFNKNHSSTFNTLLAFGHTFINNQTISETKTITFPLGYDVADTTNDMSMAFKVVFVNGHNSSLVESTPANMTLNNVLIVSNQNGTLAPLPIHNMSGTYKCLQPNTCLELYYTNNYDGNNTPAYVIIGNPIVLSSSDYIIYADGSVGTEPIGNLITYYGNTAPYGYLSCDGSTFNQVIYPKLYAFLGSTTLPDYRECGIVGIGQNSTNTIGTHDIYTLGQFKDDQFQNHTHNANTTMSYLKGLLIIDPSSPEINAVPSSSGGISLNGVILSASTTVDNPNSGRHGDVTHGKQKGALICIKAM